VFIGVCFLAIYVCVLASFGDFKGSVLKANFWKREDGLPKGEAKSFVVGWLRGRKKALRQPFMGGYSSPIDWNFGVFYAQR